MSSIEATELKLRTSPTGGVEAAQSAMARRLGSAGYKGLLQGAIGGGSLYGTFGLITGALVATPLCFFAGAAALALIPLFGAVGAYKGASTFANINSYAAITAEAAELSEQRRYLLDRYYDLPEGKEGDREAEVIKQELYNRQADAQKAPHFFHWKTLAIGAVIGAVIGLAVCSPPGIALLFGEKALATLAATLKLSTLFTAAGASLTGFGFGALTGAVAGATIGIDRYYIRRWFDHTQNVVHPSSHLESALIERTNLVNRLKTAHGEDQKTYMQENAAEAADIANAATAKAKESSTATVANAAPATNVQTSSISRETLERRAEALKGIEV